MGWFSGKDEDNRTKRKSCRNCGGLGKFLTTETQKIKDRRTGEVEKIKYKVQTKCRKCGGSGLDFW